MYKTTDRAQHYLLCHWAAGTLSPADWLSPPLFSAQASHPVFHSAKSGSPSAAPAPVGNETPALTFSLWCFPSAWSCITIILFPITSIRLFWQRSFFTHKLLNCLSLLVIYSVASFFTPVANFLPVLFPSPPLPPSPSPSAEEHHGYSVSLSEGLLPETVASSAKRRGKKKKEKKKKKSYFFIFIYIPGLNATISTVYLSTGVFILITKEFFTSKLS